MHPVFPESRTAGNRLFFSEIVLTEMKIAISIDYLMSRKCDLQLANANHKEWRIIMSNKEQGKRQEKKNKPKLNIKEKKQKKADKKAGKQAK